MAYPQFFTNTCDPGEMRRLAIEATLSANWRGHVLLPFKLLENHSSTQAIAYCNHCKAWVIINCKPLPNEIDIGGTAVAITCERVSK